MKKITNLTQQGAHEHTPAQQNKIQYPPSVQNDLFNYLKPEQQNKIRIIMHTLKKKAQVELATSLLDYLETGKHVAPETPFLSDIFYHIIDNEIIRPLAHR